MEKLSKEQLEHLYWDEHLTFEAIGTRYGVSGSTVVRWAGQYSMKVRSPKKKENRPTKEWLIQRHFVEGVTWDQIMLETGYSAAGMHQLLRRYGIPRRTHNPVDKSVSPEELYQWYVVEGMTAVKIAARIGRDHTSVSRALHRLGFVQDKSTINCLRVPPISKDELHQLYFLQRLSASAIGKQYGVSFSTVKRWLQDYELLPKSQPERAKKAYARTKVPRLGNGFNADERYRILQRDQWHCQMPGCGCSDKRILEAHHIVAVAQGGSHDLLNGITLCRTCHFKIKNREAEYAPLFSQIVTML